MVTTPPDRMPGTVVLFGASGFVGRNLMRALKPHVGRILPVSSSGSPIDGVPVHRFADLKSLAVEPEAIAINVAAYRYDAANFAEAQTKILLRNVEIAGRVYEFCAARGITEVRAASSIAVYPADEVNFDDGAPLDLGRDPHAGELMYGWSKRIAELYGRLFATRFGTHTLAFRLTNPYGPYDSLDEAKAHVVPAFVIRALTSTGPFAVRGNPEASRDLIYIGDVCEIFRRSLIWRGRSGVYNLGSGENVSIRRLAEKVLALTGAEREIVTKGAATSTVDHRSCRNARLRADFDFSRFISLDDGLRSTIEWYQNALKQ